MLTYTDKYAPWEHYPKTLSHEEIQHPVIVLTAFFHAGRAEDHGKELKGWLECVTSEKIYSAGTHGPGSLLFFYDLNLKLLEAAFLLLIGHQQNKSAFRPVTEEQLKVEQEKWEYYPGNLSTAEQSDPYQTIKTIFDKVSPQLYRDFLQEWVHTAFYNHPIDEAVTAGEVILIYDNLLKLYAAAWVILQRSLAETKPR